MAGTGFDVALTPVRPGREAALVELMEGVEDIPGSALAEGIPWGWESFADYRDVIDARRYSANVACHIAHGPVRYFVMGERAYEDHDASEDDVAEMARIVREGMEAGALGFSTSRTIAHMAIDGEPVPGTFAAHDELFGIGRVLDQFERHGAAVFGVGREVDVGHAAPSQLADDFILADSAAGVRDHLASPVGRARAGTAVRGLRAGLGGSSRKFRS